MQSKKKRPTSTSKTARLRTEVGSHVGSHASQIDSKPMPRPSRLIAKKYYYPAIREEEKHKVYMFTRFVSGRNGEI
jgi:hypothetical protein